MFLVLALVLVAAPTLILSFPGLKPPSPLLWRRYAGFLGLGGIVCFAVGLVMLMIEFLMGPITLYGNNKTIENDHDELFADNGKGDEAAEK